MVRHVARKRKVGPKELAGSANHVQCQSGLAHLDIPHARVHDCRVSHGHERREGQGFALTSNSAVVGDGTGVNSKALAVVSTT